jgi:hypothetical protein
MFKKSRLFIFLARSILRTFIDEGRVSAKQRAGTRLRFITEEEAEMIREMKRSHPLITIGQIQMRLQRSSNRVLSKASISRILTNSIRLGKRAKRSVDGEDEVQDDINGQDELIQSSDDEGADRAIYIDDEPDDGVVEDDEDGILENNSSLQNLDDFQRFMLRKTSVNGDESTATEGTSWDTKGRFKTLFKKIFYQVKLILEQYDENGEATCGNGYTTMYPTFGSEDDEDEVKEKRKNRVYRNNSSFSSYRKWMKMKQNHQLICPQTFHLFKLLLMVN